MNKKLISAAVLLGVSGMATAMNVNPDGMGQVLLFPYYTVNQGTTTNIHVVNTSNTVKAVKVRLSEGVNTWEVLDFNLYLSPYDVWSAGVSMGENGSPILYTSDTSCTYPHVTSFSEGGIPLNSYNITVNGPKTPESILGSDVTAAERLTEGHIEVIDMGSMDVTKGSEFFGLVSGIIHTNGVPANCDNIDTAWTGGDATNGIPDWSNDATLGFLDSNLKGANSLFGSASIFDISRGISYNYEPTAIADFFDPTKSRGIAHTASGSSLPNLNGDVTATTDVDNKSTVTKNVGSVTTNSIDANGNLVTSTWARPVDALSASLMTTAIYNEYFTFEGTNSATDWVITFPTKHFYVNQDTSIFGVINDGAINGNGSNGFATWGGSAGSYTAVRPFALGFTVPVDLTVYDTEEGTHVVTQQSGVFSPAPIDPSVVGTAISYEINVIEFNNDRKVFGSKLANNINDSLEGFNSGWMQLNFSDSNMYMNSIDPATAASDDANTAGTLNPPSSEGIAGTYKYKGVPAIGFAATTYVNGTLNGGSTLANYATIFAHKYTRSVTSN